jgi:hypothetical protein
MYVRPTSLTPTSTWQSASPTTFQTNNETGSNPVNLGAQPDKFFFEPPPPSNKSQTVSGHGTQCDRCGWNFDNESFLQVIQRNKTLTITIMQWNTVVFAKLFTGNTIIQNFNNNNNAMEHSCFCKVFYRQYNHSKL